MGTLGLDLRHRSGLDKELMSRYTINVSTYNANTVAINIPNVLPGKHTKSLWSKSQYWIL